MCLLDDRRNEVTDLFDSRARHLASLDEFSKTTDSLSQVCRDFDQPAPHELVFRLIDGRASANVC